MASSPSKSSTESYPADPARLFPEAAEWSALAVECAPGDYSPSRIARAVEDCDALLLNLNVISGLYGSGPVSLEIRTDHRNPESIARSLERYGYNVTAMLSSSSGDDPSDPADVARDRINQLIRYLEI